MESRTYILSHDTARQRAAEDVKTAPVGWAVKVSEPTRNLEQNAAQWPILECFAKQRKWPVDGEMVYMTTEEWKDVLTAAFEQESIRLAKGINGGFVMVGRRTREYGKKKFSDWLAFLHATAIELDVNIS